MEIEWSHFGSILEFLSCIVLFSLQSLVYFSNTPYLNRVLASYFHPVVFLFAPFCTQQFYFAKKFSAVTLLLKSSYCPNYWTKVKISSLFLIISQCFTDSVPIVSCYSPFSCLWLRHVKVLFLGCFWSLLLYFYSCFSTAYNTLPQSPISSHWNPIPAYYSFLFIKTFLVP